jgi:trk system potassium uptake protein TrkH
MCAVFMASVSATPLFSDVLTMLRRGVFMVISTASTTGFQVVTTNQLITVLSSGAILILAILMAVGGSSGSTAGGIKLSRIGLTAKSIVSSIKSAIAPDSARVSVVYHHLGRQVLDNDAARVAMTVSTLFVITYVIGALAGIAYGYDATAAIAESVAMASNGGLSFGITTQGMPKALELIYILEMWAGRLEFITLIALVVKIVVSIIPVRNGKRS